MSERRAAQRGDVVLAQFVDSRGSEIRKRRPYVVVSPDALNAAEITYILAPLTTGHHPYHFRVPCKVAGRSGYVALDQLRTRDAAEVSAPVARLSPRELTSTMNALRETFAE